MKKFNLLLVVLLGLTIGLTSCKDPVYEEPVITVPTEITIDLDNMDVEILAGTIVIDAEDEFQSVTFTSRFEDNTWAEISVTQFSGITYAFTFTPEQLAAKEGMTKIEVFVKTVNKTASANVNVTIVPVDTPLSAPETFSWHRSGTNAGTGLDVFGLEWKTNTTDFMIKITPAEGTKLVQFTDVTVWNTLTTKEALAVAIDAATSIDSFELIPAKDDTQTFNYVIATKKSDGTYYLINPTKRVLVGTSDRTVTGEYKN
ncbi:MAG: hypothetical protein LBP67_03560 [Bacteroidales bacterium]|nr:hypothetical protein [Bacteroidales bacterium]